MPSFHTGQGVSDPRTASDRAVARPLARWADTWLERLAPCPWPAAGGVRATRFPDRTQQAPLYTAAERARRDASPWTMVQAVLAPLQFAIFAASLFLVLRYLWTGQGLALATLSVVAKTMALYAIMVTGSIWEKDVFGKWLFARPFFWEDVFSILVLALHTAYLACLFLGVGSPAEQFWLALAGYAAYLVNAGQFLWKLRQARLESGVDRSADRNRLAGAHG